MTQLTISEARKDHICTLAQKLLRQGLLSTSAKMRTTKSPGAPTPLRGRPSGGRTTGPDP